MPNAYEDLVELDPTSTPFATFAKTQVFEGIRGIPQRGDYHPEKYVDIHTAYVMSGMDTTTGKVAALFHDLGKIDTTYTEASGKVTSYNHARTSVAYFDAFLPWLQEAVGGFDVLFARWLVANHMKIKFHQGEDVLLPDAGFRSQQLQDIRDQGFDLGSGSMLKDEEVERVVRSFKKADNMLAFFEDRPHLWVQPSEYRDETADFSMAEPSSPDVKDYVDAVNVLLQSIEKYEGESNFVYAPDVVLYRGVPGSGKTTLASLQCDHTIAADDFFLDEEGQYEFDGSKLGEAHNDCKRRFQEALTANEHETIGVHNTSTQIWEMIPYVSWAARNRCRFHTVVVENRWGGQSTKGVPQKSIDRMRNRFDVEV